MEVKLSQTRRIFLSLPKFHFPDPKSTYPSHCRSLKCWVGGKRSFNEHFRSLKERWRLHVQERSKGQSSSNHSLVHVVKEGETLTSISNQYGVSIPSIMAANKNTLDVDLVFEGQMLNVPASVPTDSQCQIKKVGVPGFHQWGSPWGSINVLDGFLDQKPFVILTSHGLPRAKSAGSFLVLVPIIAFCISCIIGAFYARVPGESRRQALNESSRNHEGSRRMRWKYALSDTREPDNFDSVTSPDTESTMQDEDQNSFEDGSHAYGKLEHDYQKFLSECGMSGCGYWRGGSHE